MNVSIEHIQRKARKLNRNQNLLLLFLLASKLVFIACSVGFNIILIVNNTHYWRELFRSNRLFLTIIILSSDLFTIYLFIYMYRMGLFLANQVRHFQESVWWIKFYIHVMLIISVNLCIQRMFYFTFTTYMIFTKQQCSPAFSKYVELNNYIVNFTVQPI